MSQLTVPLGNGIGRYMCQLKRIVFNYCKYGGSSRGMRKYIDEEVVQFANANPQVAVYVSDRHMRHPRIIGVYLNGNSKVICVKNMSVAEIQKQVSLLRTFSGIKTTKLSKWWHTNNPSIQGNWSPFLHIK